VIVRGQLGVRKTVKSADIVLYHKPNMALAVIEAKANKHDIDKGMQQGLDYASLLDVPFVFASNGDGYIFHDKTAPANGGLLESEISLADFPSPEQLWAKFCAYKAYSTEHAIDKLKQSILQLAVMGNLVPQDPNDEPASVLLERIAAAKERLVIEGSD
jgi:type I restriction enzyme R subunit